MYIKTLFCVSALLLSACSTRVHVQYQKSPEHPILGEKQIFIKPFSTGGQLDLDLMGSSSLLGGLANAVGNSIIQGDKDDSFFQGFHVNSLEKALHSNKTFNVNKKQTGASLQGNLSYNVTDETSTSSTKDKNGNSYNTYHLNRTALVTISLQIVDRQGAIIGNTEVIGKAKSRVQGSSSSAARNNVTSWKTLVKNAIKNTITPTLNKITPYSVSEYRTLEKGDSDLIKDGVSLADDKKWDKAKTKWLESIEKKQDLFAAYYNSGVLEERVQSWQTAQEFYEKCKEHDVKEKCSKAFDHVSIIVNDQKRIQAALEAQKKGTTPKVTTPKAIPTQTPKALTEESSTLETSPKAKENVQDTKPVTETATPIGETQGQGF